MLLHPKSPSLQTFHVATTTTSTKSARTPTRNSNNKLGTTTTTSPTTTSSNSSSSSSIADEPSASRSAVRAMTNNNKNAVHHNSRINRQQHRPTTTATPNASRMRRSSSSDNTNKLLTNGGIDADRNRSNSAFSPRTGPADDRGGVQQHQQRSHSMHFNFQTFPTSPIKKSIPPHAALPASSVVALLKTANKNTLGASHLPLRTNPSSAAASTLAMIQQQQQHANAAGAGDDDSAAYTGMNDGVFRRQYDRLDWKRLAAIDLEHMYRTKNYDALSDNLLQLTFCDVEKEITGGSDPRLLQLFKLTQLGLEFLLFNYDRASKSLERLRKERNHNELQQHERNSEFESRLSKAEAMISQLRSDVKRKKKTIAAQQDLLHSISASVGGAAANYYRLCILCGKTFIDQNYLEKHIHSRHPDLAQPVYSSAVVSKTDTTHRHPAYPSVHSRALADQTTTNFGPSHHSSSPCACLEAPHENHTIVFSVVDML